MIEKATVTFQDFPGAVGTLTMGQFSKAICQKDFQLKWLNLLEKWRTTLKTVKLGDM